MEQQRFKIEYRFWHNDVSVGWYTFRKYKSYKSMLDVFFILKKDPVLLMEGIEFRPAHYYVSTPTFSEVVVWLDDKYIENISFSVLSTASDEEINEQIQMEIGSNWYAYDVNPIYS